VADDTLNALPFSLRLTLLSGSLSASLALLKTYFFSRAFALGALLSGLYRERRYINLEIRYDTILWTIQGQGLSGQPVRDGMDT